MPQGGVLQADDTTISWLRFSPDVPVVIADVLSDLQVCAVIRDGLDTFGVPGIWIASPPFVGAYRPVNIAMAAVEQIAKQQACVGGQALRVNALEVQILSRPKLRR